MKLLKWASRQPIIGKRYLTRDWEVVRYDGTQDVVARVWRNKGGRFKDEMVFSVGHMELNDFTIQRVYANRYSNLVLMVRVSDLPDDMKGGPK